MRVREKQVIPVTGNTRMLDTTELQNYMGLGRNSAMAFGEEIGAKVKIGKRVLWDKKKVDQYLNEQTGVE